MRKLIRVSLMALLALYLYTTPVYASSDDKEIVDIEDTEKIQEILLQQQPQDEVEMYITNTTVMREERLSYEGYVLPEVVDHNIGEMDADGLALLELLSLCGKTSEFHLTLDNTKSSVIPYNYINMLSLNYTPFTFEFEENGNVVASIYTNGVTASSGNFPAHMHLAQGIDFIQISFENADAQLEGKFQASFNCYNFIGCSYDIYENNTVINTGKVDESGKITIHVSNFTTKTVKFHVQAEEPTTSQQNPTGNEAEVTAPVSDVENKIPILPIVLGIVGLIGFVLCIWGIFALNKKY